MVSYNHDILTQNGIRRYTNVLSSWEISVAEQRKAMTLRLYDDQADALEMVAEVDGVSMSEAVRLAIESHIESRRSDPDFQGRLEASMARQRRIMERLSE